MIIDPPSAFASIGEWRAFLEEMRHALSINPNNHEARECLEEAEDAIARLKEK